MLLVMTPTFVETLVEVPVETPVETPVEAPLPTHPRTVPGLDVLLRKPGEIQFGLDPRHAVVAEDLPAALVDTLRKLDGLASMETLVQTAGEQHADTRRTILTELTLRGLLEEGAPPHSRAVEEPEHSSLRAGTRARQGRRETVVAVHGASRAAVATATLLATAGVGHIDSRGRGTVGIGVLGTGYIEADVGRPYAEAMARAIRRANAKTTTTRLIGKARPTLAVLADAAVPDPHIAGELIDEVVPHLPIRVRDGIGIVGPLVIPRKTSCLRCAHLHRTDLDPCWPAVATQLAGRTRPTELSSVHALASLATGQVLRALNPADRAPNAWSATLEVDPFEGEIHRRPWEPHPDCPCGAFHGFR